MKSLESYSKRLVWIFTAFLLTAFVAGCGGDGGGTAAPASAKATTAFSIAGATGTINETTKTIAVTVPFGTDVTALKATFTTTGASVKAGTTLQTSGTTPNNFTTPVSYTVTAADGSTATYIVTVTVASVSAKAITAFSLAGVTGTIDDTAKTIAVAMPNGTNVTALAATFATTGTSVKVGTTLQTSGTTANNFSGPVTYTVTAADGSTATYIVTVTVASVSAKAITAFSLAGVTGTIDDTAKTIVVTVPFGTNVTASAATFTTTGTSVKVGTTPQTSGTTSNNFTNPVTYTVTATDGTTVAYKVTVSVALNPAKAITAFSFPGATGTINETAKTIAVTVPSGTDVTALKATFTTAGASVKVGTTAVQTSGQTPNNFSAPVAYTVTAADGSTALYTVTVTVALVNNPAAPNLGQAGRFVILASQKVTTTGTTLITNGDIGIEDQARSFYEGFTAGANPGQVNELTNGLTYAHDDIDPALTGGFASTIAFLNQVRTDLGNANSFLAADPNQGAPTQVCPIELGNLTLSRGVYKTAANVRIGTGDLTLDAQGDPNSVFIFTIDGTLFTGAPGGSIKLINKAQAKNVYWRTGGTTTIGAGTIFNGNVFAWSQVNVLAGANITGRLFALTDQVTLISNVVTKAP